MSEISTTAELEKDRAGIAPARPEGEPVPAWPRASAGGNAKRHGWPSRLRSYFIFNPLIWAYTLTLGTVSLIVSLFDRNGRLQYKLAWLWSWLIMKTIQSPVTVTGMEKVAGSRPRVYAVTHSSALDIPIIYVHLPFQFRIIFKSELLAYPFVGWHLRRSGQICINQQNPSASIGSIKSALKSLKSGTPVVIFPEGGRTPNGKILPFLPGAFFLAIKAQADIVPIALVGTYSLLPMNTYHIKSRPLEMRVGEPISTVGMTLRDTEAVSAKVRTAIEGLYATSSSRPLGS